MFVDVYQTWRFVHVWRFILVFVDVCQTGTSFMYQYYTNLIPGGPLETDQKPYLAARHLTVLDSLN